MKKILHKLFIAVCILLVILNVFSYLNISLLGFRTYKVITGSMEPYLHVNDIVVIKKCNDYKVNDVITYKKDNEYITHRIISINDNEVITKGDANNIQDEPIRKNNIVGKVVYKFKFFGFLYYLFSQPKTLVLTFVIGLIITILIPDKKKGVYQ